MCPKEKVKDIVANVPEMIGSFLGRLSFFCCIPAIICAFCMVVMRNFVYLQTTKGGSNLLP